MCLCTTRVCDLKTYDFRGNSRLPANDWCILQHMMIMTPPAGLTSSYKYIRSTSLFGFIVLLLGSSLSLSHSRFTPWNWFKFNLNRAKIMLLYSLYILLSIRCNSVYVRNLAFRLLLTTKTIRSTQYTRNGKFVFFCVCVSVSVWLFRLMITLCIYFANRCVCVLVFGLRRTRGTCSPNCVLRVLCCWLSFKCRRECVVTD